MTIKTYSKRFNAQRAAKVALGKDSAEDADFRTYKAEGGYAWEKIAPAPESKPTTKAELVLSMIRRPGGAAAPELLEATGWLPHTLRGFLSTAGRKRGLKIAHTRADGVTRYEIAD